MRMLIDKPVMMTPCKITSTDLNCYQQNFTCTEWLEVNSSFRNSQSYLRLAPNSLKQASPFQKTSTFHRFLFLCVFVAFKWYSLRKLFIVRLSAAGRLPKVYFIFTGPFVCLFIWVCEGMCSLFLWSIPFRIQSAYMRTDLLPWITKGPLGC